MQEVELELIGQYKQERDQGEIDCKKVEKRIQELEAVTEELDEDLKAKHKEKEDVEEKYRGQESMLNQDLKRSKAKREVAELLLKNEQEKQKKNTGGETGRNARLVSPKAILFN